MNSEGAEIRHPLDDAITDEQIQELIAEQVRNGAENCRVITEDGQRFLVCHLPPI